MFEIALLGHPILRAPVAQIENVQDEHIQEFISELFQACAYYDGLGLAAPQVFRSLDIFVIASKPNRRYPDAEWIAPFAVINPIIHQYATEQDVACEACLSIPGIRAFVKRPIAVTVSYTTAAGERVKQSLTGFLARAFQHEYDHVRGKVYLDRVESTQSIIAHDEYLRQLKERE